jgi:outer membrane lipoprotein SlyB
MRKRLVVAVALASLGLAGCAAYDPYYDSAYYNSPAPAYYSGSYYSGGGYYRDRGPRYYYYRDYR